ncbi:MAG: 50S ribosomal protein L6 [Acidimicrobiia bacterium]|nr:50S ribosomal protein L6 [Acidimicrobiia bacterium]
MSRIGNKVIPIPSGVKVNIGAGLVEVQGPKGKLSSRVPDGIQFSMIDGRLVAKRAAETKQLRALHGLARSLVANAVRGVTDGFQKELEIFGIGYRAEVRGKSVVFSLGFSHPIDFQIPSGINITVEKQTKLVVSGTDKQRVGQTAATIRSLKKPDPYKNKGIRYAGETLKKKVGKTGAK